MKKNIKTCFHWTNVRPLEKNKNLIKSNLISMSDNLQHEIRLKIFSRQNHIEKHVLNVWNGALITAAL